MICLVCNEKKRLNRGICQECRDRILRPHYIENLKEVKPARAKKNVK